MTLNPNFQQPSTFEDVLGYVLTLQALASESPNGEHWENRCNAALNGEANRELRRIVPIDVRRKFGIFFTSSKLSTALVSHCQNVGAGSIFFDPTCGMGDLLLAIARSLPLEKTLHQTLTAWGKQLSGTDLHSEFIEGAKIRLTLLAKHRHRAENDPIDPDMDYFPHIRVADALAEQAAFNRATHILMNPPFGTVQAPNNCKWGSGRMTAASVFMAATLERIREGTEVLAILPDVLRSGSNFNHWRHTVSSLANVHLVEPFGIFDDSADVDVFLLRLIRKPAEAECNTMAWPTTEKLGASISDFFNVRVGRVVPHRDEPNGAHHPYIHPRGVIPWAVMTDFAESRNHEGGAFKPPFVVIRRTSRPEQPYRAIATVIGGHEPVFVENHLIVCQPHDGSLKTCKRLMKQLQTEKANDFLNSRIRCRHLTVAAIRDVPIEGNI